MGKKHKRSKAHSRFLLQVRLFCQKTCKTYDFVLLFQSENAKTEISITHHLRRISSASADFTDTAILRLCFGRAVFICQVLFLLDWGARLRRSVGCPEGARQTRVSNRCSSIAWAAGPPQRCTPVQQALILPVLRFYGSASAEPFLFVRCFSCWTGGHDCAGR